MNKLFAKIRMLIANLQENQRRLRNAQELAKIAMSTTSWNSQALTRKVLRHQELVKRDAVAANANFYIGLNDNAMEQHIDFNVSEKTATIKFKME